MSEIALVSGETVSTQNHPGQTVTVDNPNGPGMEQTDRVATRKFSGSEGSFEVTFRVSRNGTPDLGQIVPFDVPLRITVERTDDE